VSRISSGVVTTAQSDVDLVVTEYGVADLRAADLTERRRRLIAVAHPDRREDLAHKLGDSEEMK
jgi:acetyl-CoA hydrolase